MPMVDEAKKQLDTMKEKVLTAIETRNVSMRSRSYFLIRTALWIAGTLLVFVLTLYLTSFAAFVFRGNGLHLLPQLGPQGWGTLLLSLPWLVLLSLFVVFVILQILSTHFSFVYKRPLVHTILGSIFILVIGSVAIAQTALHERAYRLSEEGRLPFGGPLYSGAMHDRDDMHIGTITTLTDSSFILAHRNGETYHVIITDTTRLPRRTLENGDVVIVLGDDEDDVITAFGIRPFRPGDALLPPRHGNTPGERLMPSR